MTKQPLRVILAQPRGFCAGVVRAVDIVERALQVHGAPVYVRHEIVHNKHVVESLREKGARFVEEVDEIPRGAVTVFSAHGVSLKVVDDAGARDLQVIDATCPLVSKVHNETRRFARRGCEVVLIGHRGHPEVEGTMGQVSGQVHLVSCLADVAALTPADPDKLSLCHADDPQRRRHARDHRGAEGPLSGDSRSRREGHLLRHAESADRGAAAGAAVRPESWSSEPTTARTPTGCGRLAKKRGPPAISSRTPAASIGHGSTACARWESRPAHRRPRCSFGS